MIRTTVSSLLLAAALPTEVCAQGPGPVGPNVLDLNAGYHVGVYGASIAIPAGQITVYSQNGILNFAPGGTLSGALEVFEWDLFGSAYVASDPVNGGYHVAPDGTIELDFDLANPGTDVLDLFIDGSGSTMHTARYEQSPETVCVLAVQTSTGQSNASLNGSYHYYEQYMELSGTSMQTIAGNGVVTFDGNGGYFVNGTNQVFASNGTSTTSPWTQVGTYTVAPDGALVLDGSPGGITVAGDMFFITTGYQTHTEVGMTIGVRIGANYNHDDLTGYYSLHGQSHVLGNPPSATSITDHGNLQLAGTGPTTGTWEVSGVTVDNHRQNIWMGTLNGSGTSQLAGNGTVTMNPNGIFEFAFADTGNFLVGRVNENNSNLWFGMRQCPPSFDFGVGTPGSGNLEPELGMLGFPELGNQNWHYGIIDGLGGAPAILPIAFADSPFGIPLSGGQLWLDPLAIAAAPFVVLGGPLGQPGAGALDFPLPIPPDPSFAGMQLFAQAMVLDPQAPGSVAMSRGFAVEFCR